MGGCFPYIGCDPLKWKEKWLIYNGLKTNELGRLFGRAG